METGITIIVGMISNALGFLGYIFYLCFVTFIVCGIAYYTFKGGCGVLRRVKEFINVWK